MKIFPILPDGPGIRVYSQEEIDRMPDRVFDAFYRDCLTKANLKSCSVESPGIWAYAEINRQKAELRIRKAVSTRKQTPARTANY